MGQEFFSLFHLETKRLVWLIAITFAVIISFQYLELPYGNILLSLFSADKISTTAPSPESEIASNATIVNEANSTVEHDLGMANRTNMSATITGFVLEQGSPPNKPIVFHESDQGYNITMGLSFSTNGSGKENITSRPENRSASSYAYSPSPSPEKAPAPAPAYLTPPFSPATNLTTNITSALLSNDSNKSLSQNDKINSIKEGSLGPTANDGKKSFINIVPQENVHSHIPVPEVTSVSEMTKLLLQSHASYRSMRPTWFSPVDQELLQARLEIENAPIIRNDPNFYAPIYQNVSMFKRSYELMEKSLKVYVYREGDRPILHSPFLTGIYASEGWFMKLMEANKRFATKDPKKAHLFYLPFSSRKLEETLYVKDSHSRGNLVQYLHDYVDLIAGKHPFWNRTGGADHFLVGCHDWTPAETRERLANCIRAMCNADVKEGFVFGKDASLPETYVRNALNPTRDAGGYPPSKRTTLAFFAGQMHGYVRPILLQNWENKDPDMKIFGKLPRSKGNRNYIQYMKSSKYCICARGYEVNSPRVVEAISFECVPVIISDNFVPPFFEVLNWESFAVIVLEKDIPNLKNILLSIPEKRYLRLLMRVKKVQKHFLWHKNPVKYDVFHMILHSIWYNRVFSATAR